MQAQELIGIIAIVRGIAEKLITDPRSLQVYLKADGVTIRVVVNPRDMGKIIGKQGRTAYSIRLLVDAMALKYGGDLKVQIVSSSSANS